jgi:hypothetical protein
MTEKYMSEKMLKKFGTKKKMLLKKTNREELTNLVIVINLQILHR